MVEYGWTSDTANFGSRETPDILGEVMDQRSWSVTRYSASGRLSAVFV